MRNKLDELHIKGLRNRYFRKPSIEDLTMTIDHGPKKFPSVNIVVSIGLHKANLSVHSLELYNKIYPKLAILIENKSILSLKRFITFIESLSDEFNGWQFNKFLSPMRRLVGDDLNAIPKFGCLTEEGQKELKKLHQSYNSIGRQIDDLRESFAKIKFDTNVLDVSRSNMGTDAMFTAKCHLKIILSKIKRLEGNVL